MDGHSLLMADGVRAEQFRLLSHTCRLLHDFETWTDDAGITWAGKRLGDHVFALTWLGPGWVFDPFLADALAGDLAERWAKMDAADASKHMEESLQVLDRLRLGPLTERMIWALVQAVRTSRSSILRRPHSWFFRKVWGPDQATWPKDHRKQVVLGLLESLTWLHVAKGPEDGWPTLGIHTALLSDVTDLGARDGGAADHGATDHCAAGQGAADCGAADHRDGHVDDDACSEDCPDRDGPPHHHIQVNVGRGLLGLLEQFAHDDQTSGVRTYKWPIGGTRKSQRKTNTNKTKEDDGPTLRKLGKNGGLQSFYLPAILGKRTACDVFTPRQQRLLQSIVREMTRRTGKGDDGAVEDVLAPNEAAIITGDQIRDTFGRKFIKLPALQPDKTYVTFGGNKRRKGLGYKLMTEGGWLARGGDAVDDVGTFLDDLAALADPLGLIVIGIQHPTQELLDLGEMHELASSRAGLIALEAVHLRIYTEVNYLERWDALFGWDSTPPVPRLAKQDPTHQLQVQMTLKSISRRQLALGIDVDPSFLSKIFAGKKLLPPGLLEKARAWLAGQGSQPAPEIAEDEQPEAGPIPSPPAITPAVTTSNTSMFSVALGYLKRGWSVVPQLPGSKRPTIKWKVFQDRLPIEEEVFRWYRRWPDAGVAVVLGLRSKLFVVDIDGPEACQVLLDRLGGEPVAPKALSGSGKPHRFHLFFRCPELPTKAMQTPWHPQLEFRGQGGIIIAPPSLHKSGRRYVWAKGRSPDDLELPELPPQVQEALKPASLPLLPSGKFRALPGDLDASFMTRRFLAGRYSEGPQWNNRLFLAACDLNGRGHDLSEAQPLLLAGAQPWNRGEEEAARRTIRSAYSQAREAGYA